MNFTLLQPPAGTNSYYGNGRSDGQVDSVLAFYYADPSLILGEVYNFAAKEQKTRPWLIRFNHL